MRWLIELRDIEADEDEIREIRRSLAATLAELGKSARTMTCQLAVAEQVERLRSQPNGPAHRGASNWMTIARAKRRMGAGPSA